MLRTHLRSKRKKTEPSRLRSLQLTQVTTRSSPKSISSKERLKTIPTRSTWNMLIPIQKHLSVCFPWTKTLWSHLERILKWPWQLARLMSLPVIALKMHQKMIFHTVRSIGRQMELHWDLKLSMRPSKRSDNILSTPLSPTARQKLFKHHWKLQVRTSSTVPSIVSRKVQLTSTVSSPFNQELSFGTILPSGNTIIRSRTWKIPKPLIDLFLGRLFCSVKENLVWSWWWSWKMSFSISILGTWTLKIIKIDLPCKWLVTTCKPWTCA